ncbi:hypothetical protein GLOIN_2v1771509 [Rhizophagus irregularis DAOM 181602=DAOM 197198]|nr:hypothetical protein GLOIN_2v1771509 [Rhizophagus irregularis DAOM 181602=DAOM 197198]
MAEYKEDILKKQYISVKEMKFLIDQVSSKTGYNILKKEIFINHSFDKKHFYELRKKKKSLFDLEDNIVTEKSISFSKEAKIENIMQILEVLKISEQRVE